MKKNIFTLAVIGFLIVAMVVLTSCTQYGSQQNNPPAANAPLTTPPATMTSTGQTHNVDIQNFAFSPGSISIKIGDTVIPAQHFGPQLLDQRFPAGPNIPHKVVNISPYMDAAGVNATNVDMVPVQQDLTHPQVAQQQVVGQNLYPGQKI